MVTLRSLRPLLGLIVVPPALAATPPTANAQSVSVQEDRSRVITLTGTDPSGGALTYTVDTAAGHTRGALSCSADRCTYTPATNFNGPDQFYFQVSNGTDTSTRAAVSVTVNAVNDAPTASARSGVVLNEDTVRSIGLTGADVDGDTLSYQVQTSPRNGTTTIAGTSAVYTPNPNFNGVDSFTFRTYDGVAYSAAALVSVTVTAVGDRPTAANVAVSLDEDDSTTFTLGATDADGDPLTPLFSGVGLSGSTYTTLTDAHGTFTVSGLQVTYTPPADFHGADGFTYTVNDGSTNATPYGTVSINVASVNDAPVATSQWARAANGAPAHVVLTATDADGDALSYSITSTPRRGTATLWNGNKILYNPTNPSVRARDSFNYQVTDGIASTSESVVLDLVPSYAKFPLDAIAVDESIAMSTTVDGYAVLSLPHPATECAKSQSAHPTFEGSLLGASVGTVGVVASHYNGLTCGYTSYVDTDTSIYVIANTGVAGEYEARLLDIGYNVEASGLARDDGTLMFTTVSAAYETGGLLVYTPGSADDPTAVTSALHQPVARGTDASPWYDPGSGVTLFGTTVVPELCGDAGDDDCGVLASVDSAGQLVDILDEDDNHHAWASAGCISVAGERYCGFAAGSDAAGANYQDDNACVVARISGMPTPPVTSSTVAATLSVDAVHDPGAVGCSPVDDLQSAMVNGGLASDGTWIYAMAYGSDSADDTTRIYQYDSDLNPVQTFEIPAGSDHRFTNGYYASLVVAANGKLYTTGLVDYSGGLVNAVVELDPATGATNLLSEERVTSEGQYGAGQLYVNAAGDEVIVYTSGNTGIVTRLSDGATVDAFELGTSDGEYTAPPVLIADGNGEEDALMFVATDNVVTIVPDSGLTEDTDAPWPGPRRDARMQATIP